ncbi:MAG: TonB family protein [Candidatus Omnitrophica bacterium]|nr:TonB family protein [Candidatus Omnitrophota bacterium]
MNQENAAPVTLLLSLIIHGAILATIPFYKNIPQKKELTNLEVTYKSFYAKKGMEDRAGISKELLSVKQKELPRATMPQEKPRMEQPYKFDTQELAKPQETIAVSKPDLPMSTPKKQKIILRDFPVETSKDPAYLNYREIIRKKIQDKVYYYSEQYFYFDYPREGKIFVAFTIGPDGRLVSSSIVENKSSQDNTLKKIVITSIEKASPFQKIPKDLRYGNHSFNLEISFEIQ